MAKASVITPVTSPEPAFDRRWPSRVEYTSPTVIELLRQPPSGPVEVDPDSNVDDDADDASGVARGLVIWVPIGASMWGAIG